MSADTTALPRIRPMRVSALHGAWGAAATAAGAAVESTTASGNSGLIVAAIITMAGGVVVAVIGPFVTAWARSRFGRHEQKSLNELMLREMEQLHDDNEALRTENKELRDQLRIRRR